MLEVLTKEERLLGPLDLLNIYTEIHEMGLIGVCAQMFGITLKIE